MLTVLQHLPFDIADGLSLHWAKRCDGLRCAQSCAVLCCTVVADAMSTADACFVG